MRSFLPRTRREAAAALGLALLTMVGVPALYGLVTPASEPIAIAGSDVSWDLDHRALVVRSGERTYTTSCPSVLIARWLEVRDGPPVYIEAEVLEGPLGGRGILPPRRETSLEGPRVIGPSTLRLQLPEWLTADKVLAVVVRISVPTNKPCANGYAGSYDLYRLAVP